MIAPGTAIAGDQPLYRSEQDKIKKIPIERFTVQAQRHRRPTWQRQLHYWYYRLLRLSGTPAQISRGVAAGAFAGWFPLFGLQTILGLLLATLLRGNRLAAAAATWISNPFTYVPIYAFNFGLGQWLLPLPPIELQTVDWNSFAALTEMGGQFVLTLAVGCTVGGLVVALLCYGLSYGAIARLRQLSEQRR
ncbi:MAG: DUF2062 domain-containing protein, partial [Spirulinaceae cyanobacterium]